MPGFKLGVGRSNWSVARQRFKNAQKNVVGRQRLVVKRAALKVQRELVKGIKDGAPGGKKFKKLSFITRLLRRKNSSKPLIDSGSLWRSIKITYDSRKNAAFVGVHRTSRTKDGKSLVNVAVIHEFGTKPFTIRITQKMRNLFLYLSMKTGGKIRPISPSKKVILHPGIPARPFVRPTIEKMAPKLQKDVLITFKANGGPI